MARKSRRSYFTSVWRFLLSLNSAKWELLQGGQGALLDSARASMAVSERFVTSEGHEAMGPPSSCFLWIALVAQRYFSHSSTRDKQWECPGLGAGPSLPSPASSIATVASNTAATATSRSVHTSSLSRGPSPTGEPPLPVRVASPSDHPLCFPGCWTWAPSSAPAAAWRSDPDRCCGCTWRSCASGPRHPAAPPSVGGTLCLWREHRARQGNHRTAR